MTISCSTKFRLVFNILINTRTQNWAGKNERLMKMWLYILKPLAQNQSIGYNFFN